MSVSALAEVRILDSSKPEIPRAKEIGNPACFIGSIQA